MKPIVITITAYMTAAVSWHTAKQASALSGGLVLRKWRNFSLQQQKKLYIVSLYIKSLYIGLNFH